MSQGVHSVAEQYVVLAAVKTLAGGRSYDGMPDEADIPYVGSTGKLKPYTVVTFGIPVRSASGRSLLGARFQPYIQPFTVDCYGGSAGDARDLASAVINLLLGLVPDAENASEIELSGGGDFRERDTQGRPTRYIKRVQGEYLINMHSPDV